MLHRVIILKRARQQFLNICDYLDNEFGVRTGDAFISEAESCIASLRKFPESGHPEPISDKYAYRSKIVGKYNKIFYFVRRNTLVIAAFADMRMHPDNVKRAVSGK